MNLNLTEGKFHIVARSVRDLFVVGSIELRLHRSELSTVEFASIELFVIFIIATFLFGSMSCILPT